MHAHERDDLMRLLSQQRYLEPQTATREALAGVVGPIHTALGKSIAEQEAKIADAKRRLNPDPPTVPAVTARTLPRTRDRFVNGLVDKTPDLRKYRAALVTADLFWVTTAMADLTTAAAETIPDQTLERTLAPADTGLMVFDKARSVAGDVAARGLAWHFTGAGLLGFVLADAGSAADELAHRSATVRIGDTVDRQRARNAALVLLLDTYGPLVAVGQFLVPFEVEARQTDDERVNVAWLRTAWALMAQPFLCETRTVAGDPATTVRPGGKVRPVAPDVTLVDLRHARTVADGEPGHSGRKYGVRWVVRGHWRNQACGPGRTSHRLIFVDPYTKGPEGAPLRAAPKVNVWRR